MIRHHRSHVGALNCPVLCRLTGPLDPTALGAALTALAGRHESLRTTFTGRGARLRQQVNEPRDVPVELRFVSPAALAGEIAAELAAVIDPGEWPARVTLWRLSADEHVLCLNLHHLVTDAWSTGILLRDLALCYAAATGGAAVEEATGWQYGEFATWQQDLLAGDGLLRHREYWRRQLTGAALPALGPATAAGPGGTLAADLPAPVVAGLRELARRERTTLFTVLLALFLAALHRTTGQDDLAVASMFANRSRPEVRETVGLLANMTLLRARPGECATFTDLLRQTHSAVIGAFTYQDLPFQLLPTDVLDTGGARADDVVFNVMADLVHTVSGGPVEFELLVPDDVGSRFPLELALVPIGAEDLRVVLFRADDRLDDGRARDFLAGYAALAEGAASRPGEALSTLLSGGVDNASV